MWEAELEAKKNQSTVINPVGSSENWYTKANEYWNVFQFYVTFYEKTDSTYDGVLGGYGNLSNLDINFSLGFIVSIAKERPEFVRKSAIDCGAGIGRIAKDLLCQVFQEVDLVDQCEKYVEKAKEIVTKKTMRNFYCEGLQKFEFKHKYDCIWIQWVFSHLSDNDGVEFLKRAQNALNEGGVIILKENHCSKGFIVDKTDFSVTRSTELFQELFSKAGLKIVKKTLQNNWPKDLFQIWIYALE